MFDFKEIKMDILNLTYQEKVILISLVLGLINPYLLAVFATFVLFKEIKNGLLKEIKKQPGYKPLYIFIALGFMASILHKNLMGIVNMFGYLILFFYMLYYRKHISKKLIVYILETIIFISIFVNIFGLIQFKYLSNLKGYSFFEFKIQNSPKYRITAGYWNANFYAMMIEYTIICCMARFVQCKRIVNKVWYVCIGLFNLFLMYLTGCRAAFMPFVVFVPIFLFISKENKWAWASIVCLVVLGVAIYFYPNLVPRVSDTKTVASRVKIWTCAMNGFKDYPLFGQGPQAYNIIYPVYNGHKAPHAHNIYIDVLINFGVVGTTIMLSYYYYMVKEVFVMRKWKENRVYFGIAISFLIIVLIHGIMDVTINMPSTAFIFLLFMNMAALPYNDEKAIVLKEK